MPETLLSFSEVLLFGRALEDVAVVGADDSLSASAATTKNVAPANLKGLGPVDNVGLAAGDNILLVAQTNKSTNGLYKVLGNATNDWSPEGKLPKGTLVTVTAGDTQAGVWRQMSPFQSGLQNFKKITASALRRGLGQNKQLGDQIAKDAQLARIYGFAYEGAYYELPAPTIFLVHGEGESATSWVDPNPTPTAPIPQDAPLNLAARSPNKPDLSGVAAADFQIANDIRVWHYDQADYSVRMDVMTGQFEQILLDVYFGVEEPMLAGGRVSGGRVSGGRVSGGRVSGGRVSGGRVSGGRVSGGRVSGSGD